MTILYHIVYESADVHVDLCDLFSVRKTSDRDGQSRLRNEPLHPVARVMKNKWIIKITSAKRTQSKTVHCKFDSPVKFSFREVLNKQTKCDNLSF